ncbi:MAG: bifunctional diaminohydroxyphosphoribosylaminopyrimidine deaminase/5-amino-6-(5-phosphoribosylamino)uracil reductase RibD [Crocinitomicaceae bacterium]|nr:bifunctional diaminohydroxyphosphoribosylaminopyrimidine deaminase/5-amino-6-(5-phosphoribosylamino)uracil reductase RibD [Crocinitomicaceae bacterium]
MTDEFYIQRCIDLALKGKGNVAPNPMVGAVIVYNDEIIGEGYHQKYGEAHAEVNAVNSVKNKGLLCESTIYVSLEPCSHYGKTSPCSDLLVASQFKRVVIGSVDSNSKVAGKGIEKLRNAGIAVTVGVLEKECRELNKRFFTFHENKRPYVILKWAQTKDGFIDKFREKNETGIYWITGPQTKKNVHQWRAEEAAILVGKNTVLNDNPSLTVREVAGKNPIRVVLDSQLSLAMDASVFSCESPTIVFNTIKSGVEGTITWIQLEQLTPAAILQALFEKNIQSIIVEGGKQVLDAFIQSRLWDEARILTGNIEWNGGIEAPQLPNSTLIETYKIEEDLVEIYHPFQS